MAPELVADLTDLLRRVTGRAASDQAGAITIKLAAGVSLSDVERDLGMVVHRWSEMHPGVRVQVTADDAAPRPPRRRTRRRGVGAEESMAVAGSVMAAPPQSS